MKFISLILALLALQVEVYSQGGIDELYAEVSRIYFDSMGIEQTPIYLGEIDPLSAKSRSTNPFFNAPSWQDGSIKFDDAVYINVSFLYDLEDQQLILRPVELTKRGGVSINQSKVEWFKVGGGFFRKSIEDENDRFFQVLIEGYNFNLLGHRRKIVEASSSGVIYAQRTDFFLEYNDKLYPIRSKGDLKKLFPDYNRINQAIKSMDKKLKYSKLKEEIFTAYMKAFDEKIQK